MHTRVRCRRDVTILTHVVAWSAVALWFAGQVHGKTVEPLSALKLSLHTGNPITVAEKGREDQFYFQVVQPKGAAKVKFRLHLVMTDHTGRESDWTSSALSVAPGESVKVPLARVIPALGWWRVRPTIRALDGKVNVAKLTRDLAYIDPVGPRKLPPPDEFWFGLDSRVRTPAMLRLFAQMGVDILRFGTWAGVNPRKGQWNFESFDRVVNAIRAAKMQALYSVTFTPSYAIKPMYRGKGDPSRLPPRSEALRASLQKIITHTRDKGLTVYDLWNEPDHRGFWRGNTKDYLEFMRVAYETIKSVQPKATVLSGGIASLHQGRTDGLNPDMDRRIVLEGRKWYDALALHEHGSFDRFAKALDGPLAGYRKRLKENIPLWFTETGYDGDGHDKAVMLVQKVTYARAHNAKGLIWYAVYPPGKGGRYNITDNKGDPEPVLPAYNHLVRMMRGKRFAQAYKDKLRAGNRLFAFKSKKQILLVAWGKGATAYRVPVRVADGAEAQAFDIMGQHLKLERSGNTVFLPFARPPRYLQVSGQAKVGDYQAITPLALFEFGGVKPARGARHINVSPLKMVGWKRHKLNDRDPRMTESTSGHPNGLFDGDGNALRLRFTVTPTDGAAVDIENLSFWGNAGAFGGTTATLMYQVGDAAAVKVGSRELRNLSSPRTRGEYHHFPLSGLEGVNKPVTFTLHVDRKGERVILKIDDLRVDGIVRK